MIKDQPAAPQQIWFGLQDTHCWNRLAWQWIPNIHVAQKAVKWRLPCTSCNIRELRDKNRFEKYATRIPEPKPMFHPSELTAFWTKIQIENKWRTHIRIAIWIHQIIPWLASGRDTETNSSYFFIHVYCDELTDLTIHVFSSLYTIYNPILQMFLFKLIFHPCIQYKQWIHVLFKLIFHPCIQWIMI